VSLYMEHTQIEAAKTAGEIQGLLAGALSVSGIATEFDGGQITGLSFRIDVAGIPQTFRMPIRPEPVFRILNGRRKRFKQRNEEKDRAQSVRVAWRQVLRWIQAQIALIDTGMVDAGEVFFPYLVSRTHDLTLYDLAIERLVSGQTLLEAPEASR